MMREAAQGTIRVASRYLARRLDARIEGIEHVPRQGAALIVARHVHHLYDGCLLLAASPRVVHLLVALDWAADRRTRRLMEWACGTAAWPVMLRSTRLGEPAKGAYGAWEAPGYLRRAIGQAVGLLRAGGVLAVFPEGYPNVDPHGSAKVGLDDFLPFQPGFAGLADMARVAGQTPIPIVPAGLCYRKGTRWQVTLRFGPPMFVEGRRDRERLVRTAEQAVRQLSTPGQSLTSGWTSRHERM